MKYRIPEPGTTISGFADSYKKKKKMNADRPTPRFFGLGLILNNFHFFFLLKSYYIGLQLNIGCYVNNKNIIIFLKI